MLYSKGATRKESTGLERNNIELGLVDLGIASLQGRLDVTGIDDQPLYIFSSLFTFSLSFLSL